MFQNWLLFGNSFWLQTFRFKAHSKLQEPCPWQGAGFNSCPVLHGKKMEQMIFWPFSKKGVSLAKTKLMTHSNQTPQHPHKTSLLS